jgi:hypothetical protein
MKRSGLVFAFAGLLLLGRRLRRVEVPSTQSEPGVDLDMDGRSGVPFPPIQAPTLPKGVPEPREAPNHLITFAVVVAFGFLIVTLAFALSRSGRPFAEPLFWAGLVTIFAPATVRLASPVPSRSERLGLVLLVGVALYLVKVVHDPFQFTFADDLVHQHNANEIIRTGSLFGTNSILPITPNYPGLESVTAAFASMTGLTSFAAGTVVVGVARLVLMLALFLFFEEVSGSARIAGLAGVLYAANPNFLFFDAQFSYESLALPLVIAALFVTARWMRLPKGRARLSWAVVFALLTLAIVITHHMSSYALAFFLVVVAAVHVALGRGIRRSTPIGFAFFAIAAIVVWLVLVASETVGYLSPVFTNAFHDTVRTISAETAPRALFVSQHGGQPPWDRVVGFTATAIVALALPFGLRAIWSRYRRGAIALVLAGASVIYLAMLGLRFVGGAWEVGSRASEFLYIGTSFVLALAVVGRKTGRLLQASMIGLALAVVFAGGVIAGRPNDLRLAQPLAVDVDDATIRPQGDLAAQWARTEVGPGHRFAADASNGRLLLVYGRQTVFTGKNPDVEDLIRRSVLRPWQVRMLRANGIDYVLIDRRRVSGSALRGYFFCVTTNPCDLFDPRSYGKFDRQTSVSKLFDSGDISIYDVAGLTGESQDR